MDANQFFINGTGLDPNRFPVPNWLLSRTLGPLQVDANQLFVATPYPKTRRVPSAVAQQACLVDINDIDGRATTLWLPTSRRHRLVPDPNQDTWQP